MIRFGLCLLLTVGCASSTGVWREVTTPHFVVRTDLDADIARRAAAVVELDRDLIVSSAWPNLEIPEWARTHVYVLSDRVEFEARFGRTESVSIAGVPDQLYLHGPPERWEPRWMPTQAPNSLLRYHVALRVASLVYPEAPAWFLNGVAQFVETVHPSEDGQSVVLGGINVQSLAAYKRYRSVSLRQVLQWEREDPLAEENWGVRGMGWLFVHWLSNVHPESFSRYRAELMKGTEAKTAFALAFPGFNVGTVDEELHRYSEHPGHIEISAPVRRTTVAFQERILTPADLHVLRAHMIGASWSFGTPKVNETAMKAEVREQVDMAVALDPTHVEALSMDDWTATPERLSRARAAATAHPDDARAWELLADVLDKAQPGSAEQENAFRKALALAPNNPDTLNGLAWLLQGQGRVAQAMPLAMKAMQRAPNRPFILDTYAAVMFKAGSCTNALAAQQKALDRLSPASRKENPDIEKRLGDYRTACAQRRPRR